MQEKNTFFLFVLKTGHTPEEVILFQVNRLFGSAGALHPGERRKRFFRRQGHGGQVAQTSRHLSCRRLPARSATALQAGA